MTHRFFHPVLPRRTMIQAGAVGLLGLSLDGVRGLHAADQKVVPGHGQAKSVIFIFLSGGLGQHDSFDMKPLAPEIIRGEFNPIATATPGIEICEHLPMLAERSADWALVRSLTHPCNEHSLGHHIMMTGRTEKPPRFRDDKPQSSDWPTLAAVASALTPSHNNLPPAVVLPERLIHRTGRTIPGQFAGQMGPTRDPWFIEASPFNSTTYGAFPEYEFHHATGSTHQKGLAFRVPQLSLPEGLVEKRFQSRLSLLETIEQQQVDLDRSARSIQFSGHREAAVTLLTEKRVRTAFDVLNAEPETQDRYGRNSFGWSLLMARRLVEAGVNFVQVNLGNNEAWDTHGNAFPHLKDFLYPPTDRAVTALLDDLKSSGMLDSTLIVMAGEFGRTPKTSTLAQHYKGAGRDHWGGVQTVFFAGGGVRGGQVIGSSDSQGAYPADKPQTPENMAATIYQALGLPETAAWHDEQNRPHHIYHGDPIPGLMG
jgi:hypothetical protein